MNKPGSFSEGEKAAKHAIAVLALFGLTEALLDPPGKSVFTEAHRIIFTESDELKKSAALVGTDIAYLMEMGFCCDNGKYH